MCNLGSINFARIKDTVELESVVYLAAKFLVCGSIRAELPFERCYEVRENYRKIGLGIMGMHEWLLKRGYQYSIPEELRAWLQIWKDASIRGADSCTTTNNVSQCTKYRCVAPAGTISIIAGTTSGIEPLYAVAMKRRFLSGNTWKYEYIIDPMAELLIQSGIDPEKIETSTDLSKDIARRLEFQAVVQEYTDMAISSTINLPSWGSEYNNDSTVVDTLQLVRKYAPRLRGLTFYPDGSRGGQPLVSIPYKEAVGKTGQTLTEGLDFLTQVSCTSGACGI